MKICRLRSCKRGGEYNSHFVSQIKISPIHGFGVFSTVALKSGDVIIDQNLQIHKYCNDAAMPDIFKSWSSEVITNYDMLAQDYEARSLRHANIRKLPGNTWICIKRIHKDEEFLVSYGLKKWSANMLEGCRCQ